MRHKKSEMSHKNKNRKKQFIDAYLSFCFQIKPNKAHLLTVN